MPKRSAVKIKSFIVVRLLSVNFRTKLSVLEIESDVKQEIQRLFLPYSDHLPHIDQVCIGYLSVERKQTFY